MLSTLLLDCVLFRRLTGRLQPKLVHPTARAFRFEEWQRIAADDALDTRDLTIARVARLIGANLGVLRTNYLAPLFEGVARETIINLAVADANRAWVILRRQHNEAVATAMASGRPGYYSSLGEIGVATAGGGPEIPIDQANNNLIDTLPHWFGIAAEAPPEPGTPTLPLDQIALRAQLMLNLEHSYRHIWQEVLWEPWHLVETEDRLHLVALFPEDMGRWQAWEHRDKALAAQYSLVARNLERHLGLAVTRLPRTVVGADETGALRLGTPTAEQAELHRSMLEVVEDSYLGLFFDQQIGPVPGLTPRLLESAICILQDALHVLLPDDLDPATFASDYHEMLRCALDRDAVLRLLIDALAINPALADAVLGVLAVDPIGALKQLFVTGLWHRPLIATADGKLMPVAGALMWGSPLRRTERWLQDAGGPDLSTTSFGLRFEADYRDRLATALSANDILAPESGLSSIAAGEAGEEIDLLVRVGSTCIVGEIKCLVCPSEPNDRFDYLRKLEDACKQAQRKARWIERHPEEAVKRIGVATTAMRIVPLVLVNQSNGIEWAFDDCLVTDTRFLELFLAGGEFSSGAALFNENSGQTPVYVPRRLYRDAREAEAMLPAIFAAIPGMDPFRDAVRWVDMPVPSMGERRLFMQFPMMDVEAYEANMAIPEALERGRGMT
ncbi:hypothetical protein [Sphingopyxis sp. 550A]